MFFLCVRMSLLMTIRQTFLSVTKGEKRTKWKKERQEERQRDSRANGSVSLTQVYSPVGRTWPSSNLWQPDDWLNMNMQLSRCTLPSGNKPTFVSNYMYLLKYWDWELCIAVLLCTLIWNAGRSQGPALHSTLTAPRLQRTQQPSQLSTPWPPLLTVTH